MNALSELNHRKTYDFNYTFLISYSSWKIKSCFPLCKLTDCLWEDHQPRVLKQVCSAVKMLSPTVRISIVSWTFSRSKQLRRLPESLVPVNMIPHLLLKPIIGLSSPILLRIRCISFFYAAEENVTRLNGMLIAASPSCIIIVTAHRNVYPRPCTLDTATMHHLSRLLATCSFPLGLSTAHIIKQIIVF